MDKIKRFIDCSVPIKACNLRCHYCFIAQHREFASRITPFSQPVEIMVAALSKERLGGTCLFNLCAGGETLLSEQILPLAKMLIEEGHYVMIVTNGTLTKRFEEITTWPEEVRQRLFIKFSFQYLEMQRLNWMDRFFGNVDLMKQHGVSFTVEVTPSDELIPHIETLKKVCMERLGALCHVSIARNENTDTFEVLSQHSFEEYKNIWGEFNSDLFQFKSEIFYQKRKEFCYAGDWCLFLELGTGNLYQCVRGEKLCNIYECVQEPIPFKAIGTKCRFPHCYNGHSYLALGAIPELEAPTYAQLRNRHCEDGSQWLQPGVKAFFGGKLGQSNKEYSYYKKRKLARQSCSLHVRERLSHFAFYQALHRLKQRMKNQ